ncbi:MAG: AlpA family phage regulatory protein [Pseudohongiella sp.]|nr:AlpA family phage regulatory protein [Pseudohongiella sp.]
MNRIMRFSEMQEVTGLSRSTIYNRLNPEHKNYDPGFPKPAPLGPRLVGWSSESVELWIQKILQ